MSDIKVRFAPSPTGFVHIGSLRTALYNYLFAKQQNGDFLIRIEDTDRTRLVEGAVEALLNSMEWSGIKVDEGVSYKDGKIIQLGQNGPYIQSERLEIYQKYIEELLEKGYAYHCFCTKERLESLREEQKAKGEDPMYDGYCRNLSKEEVQKRIEAGEEYVIRLRIPENKDVEFDDIVRGKISINSNTIDDQVLIKSDGFPTYHFAVVVDDHLMEITHVIRGEEWLTSTPKHVLLYEMFGWKAPTFVHLPNILGKDRKKLSKRQGDVGVHDFQNKGYLPEGLINYIALLGWSPEDEQEIFKMDELIEKFDLSRVSNSGGIFDVEKLNWVNSHHIKEYDIEKLVDIAVDFIVNDGAMTKDECKEKRNWLLLAMDTLRERMSYLAEFPSLIRPYLKDDMEIEEDAKEFMTNEHMPKLLEILEKEIKSKGEITAENTEEIFGVIKSEGIKGKNLFMGVRVLVTGNSHGPDMPKTMELLGKDRILKRLEQSKSLLA